LIVQVWPASMTWLLTETRLLTVQLQQQQLRRTMITTNTTTTATTTLLVYS